MALSSFYKKAFENVNLYMVEYYHQWGPNDCELVTTEKDKATALFRDPENAPIYKSIFEFNAVGGKGIIERPLADVINEFISQSVQLALMDKKDELVEQALQEANYYTQKDVMAENLVNAITDIQKELEKYKKEILKDK